MEEGGSDWIVSRVIKYDNPTGCGVVSKCRIGGFAGLGRAVEAGRAVPGELGPWRFIEPQDQGIEAGGWASVFARRSRKIPASVTTPSAWPEPRSLSLVATAGLMSTHTVFTQPGSMLPAAMECSIEPRHSTRPAPRRCSA